MLDSFRQGAWSPKMKLRVRMESQNYEQKFQQLRWERTAEMKQVERLTAILVKKATVATAQRLPGSVA